MIRGVRRLTEKLLKDYEERGRVRIFHSKNKSMHGHMKPSVTHVANNANAVTKPTTQPPPPPQSEKHSVGQKRGRGDDGDVSGSPPAKHVHESPGGKVSSTERSASSNGFPVSSPSKTNAATGSTALVR